MKITKKLRNSLITALIIIISIVAIVVIFISPIAKYLIEKYDVEYTGREIKTGVVYINPFTGYAHIGNLRLYEQKSDSIFIKADGLNINFNWTALIFRKTYELSSLTLNKPVFNISQQRQAFNFDDIIAKFTPKEKDLVKKARTKLNILDIDINNGRVNYKEKVIPVNYYVDKINIESPGMWWNRDTMQVKFKLNNGPSTGVVSGNVTINLTKKNYRLYLNIKDFDLAFMEQYIKDLANYGNFEAKLNLDVYANGGFESVLETTAKGWVALNDIHFGKTKGNDFFSMEEMYIGIKEFNPKQFRYNMDSIILTHPFFVYEMYDYLDNLQRMFGKGGSKIKAAQADSTKFNPIFTIVTQVQQIATNFLQSYYQVGKVEIKNGDIKFNDFSIREKFAVSLNPLNVEANDLDKNNPRLKVKLNTKILPFGNINGSFSIDPKNSNTFESNYKLSNVPVSLANPYLITFTSFPLDKGSIDFNGYFNAVNGNINSMNHLVVLDPRVGKRLKKKKDTKWIPVPLIMAFVRERGNVIDYEVPLKGDLKNPKVKIKDIIFDLLKNIFIKPVTIPYAFKVGNIENELEKLLTLKWETRQVNLRNSQDRFTDKIADFLKETPNTKISVQPMIYAEKEKEYILFYEAKKKFYLMVNNKKTLSKDDSMTVEKMSNKDSSFVKYLNKNSSDDMYTIQQKCLHFIGNELVNSKYAKLVKERESMFKQSFIDNGTIKQINILATKSTIPFGGFSYYSIKYNGEVPASLTDAYEGLQDINEGKTRKKYIIKRRRNKKLSGESN